MFKKWLRVPKTNETQLIEAVRLWEVRWTSRQDKYAADTRPEMEAFTSSEDAHAFAKSLEQAFRLIRHTSGNYVSVQAANSDVATLRAVS